MSSLTTRVKDPFIVELVQNGLQALCEQMFTALRRASMSMVIYERLDFGVAVIDPVGRMICQGAGLPAFIGMLDGAVVSTLKKFGPSDDIHAGDVFITNDPYDGGGSHLNDVVLSMPVFEGETLVAWLVNKAHWTDIGGISPGSMSTDSSEIYQEGVNFPNLKLFSRGQVNQAILDIVAGNSRLPESTLGDVWAGIAALRVGERRLRDLVRRHGAVQLLAAIEAFLFDGEKAALAALQPLPKGTFVTTDSMEDGRQLRVSVTISETEFIVDLRGNPKQNATPFNCPFVCTRSAAQIVYKAITTGSALANEGSFRPLKILVDEGSIFCAQRPAPVSYYFEAQLHALDLVWKALAPHMPELVGAGQINSVSGIAIGTTHPDSGKFVMARETQLGGWGGRPGRDGQNGLYSAASGESFNSPVEVYERRNGIQVDSYGFHTEDGGEGEQRGGRGITKAYRILAEQGWLTTSHIRSHYPPWALSGGNPGSPNYAEVRRADGTVELHRRVTRLPLKRGDVVIVHTATGGGYGQPSKRDPSALADDIKNGYVTPSQAERFYKSGN